MLLELTSQNAAEYLAARPEFPGLEWSVAPLGGGVSNTVLLAESSAIRLVLKQSLPKLRVAEDWPADRDRIQREWAAIEDLAPHVPPGALPEVYFTDPANYLFAMSAAANGARTWKDQLLNGECEPAIAEKVARIQGAMIRASWKSPLWERDFGDLHAFGQLRLDPYHAFTASRHPDLKDHFRQRIEEARTRRYCAVHGDWSPKNFLVSGDDVVVIDWEVIHYGDPSFDTAFLLNHLLLKAHHAPRRAAELERLALAWWDELTPLLPAGAEWMGPTTFRHLGCLLLARIDGKSPAEYIQEESVKGRVRAHARRIILAPPNSIAELFSEVSE